MLYRYIILFIVTFKHFISIFVLLKSNTKLVTFQIRENLIPRFNDKVTEEFGNYKKSKVLNALIQGYLNGKYRIYDKKQQQDKQSSNSNYYDIEC